MDRRTFTARLGLLAAFTSSARAQTRPLAFYSSQGPQLEHYDLEARAASLTPRNQIQLPSNLQYAWPHPSKRYLYTVCSNTKPGGLGPDAGGHCAQALRVEGDGTLAAHGPVIELKHRPIHTTVDNSGRFLLIVYNVPSSITVHRLASDGTIGQEVEQRNKLDLGIYAHQVRATPSGKTVIVVTRGNDARPGHPEDPGALKVFGFADGQLSNLQSLAPHGNGYGFGPRHLDFGGRYAFVSLERENAICVYAMTSDGTLSAEPLYLKNALIDPNGKFKHPGQGSGPIHVHPKGGLVYQTNRNSGTIDFKGQQVANGGENSIAVWRINPANGEPTRIQNIDSHGFEIRTFVIDPSATLLIAASQTPMLVRQGDRVVNVSAGLSLYRIGPDGRLSFIRKRDVDTSAGTQFWCGLLTMT